MRITPPEYNPTSSNPPDLVRITPASGGPPVAPKAIHVIAIPILLPASFMPPSRAGALGIKLTNAPVAQPYIIDTMTREAMLEVANGQAKETIAPTSVNGIKVLSAPNLSARIPEESRPIKEAQLAIEIK